VWVQGILGRYYSEVRPQGRSIGVKAANDVWLDIVPAAPLFADDGPLWIPDREAKAWVQTHPKGQIAAEVEKNRVTGGYYVPVVKLFKLWRDRLPTASCRLKSYILEALAHQTIGSPSSHAAGIVNVLEGIERFYAIYRTLGTVPSISDPGYSSVNVAKRWASSEFVDFMGQVKASAATARSAYDSRDEAESRRLWRSLFGSKFGA